MLEKNYKDFLVVRPTISTMMLDKNGMPIIKKISIFENEVKNIKLTNFKNLRSVPNKKNTIIDMFNYDDILNSLWNDPLRYVAKFEGFYAISSPDFSVYPNMSHYEIEHNIYKSRWLGALWQSMGVNVIPTISWASEDTYDVCFSGIEKDSVVIISTLGVCKNKDTFIKGFNEMKKRLNPSYIIVVGRLFDEMEGNFLLYSLEDTFNQKRAYEKLCLFECPNLIIRQNGVIRYGW